MDGESKAKIVIAVGVVFLVIVGLWFVGVILSRPVGAGDAYVKNQSAENRTQMQRAFNQKYQAVVSADKNINIAAVALARDPDNTKRQIEYDGLVRVCNDTVGSYNSLVREYLAKDWKDTDLPDELDGTDPKTDCEEDK